MTGPLWESAGRKKTAPESRSSFVLQKRVYFAVLNLNAALRSL